MVEPLCLDRFRTIYDALRRRAAAHGNRPLYTFLRNGDADEITLTYAGLDRRARQIGAWLQDRKMRGQRVLLVYHQELEYIAALFGCLYSGAIPVPAYPPRRNRRAARICAMVADAGISIALTGTDLFEQMRPVIAAEPMLASLTWQATDRIEESWVEAWIEPDIDESSIAFLQYTSGSTGTPKGVMVSHGNLIHNQQLIHASFRQTESIVVAGWLPLFHDMGLIGNVLHPLYLGGRLVFISPAAFLQKPIRWLRMISQYRATIGGGPNFAYELCVHGITRSEREGLDLSSWQVAYNGAEPVRERTLRDFVTEYGPYGFSDKALCPCYGMAETTLLVAGAVNGEPVVTTLFDTQALTEHRVVSITANSGQSKRDDSLADNEATSLVACGIPDASLDVRIVDPDSHVQCPPDRAGEIWVSGQSVAQGYWNRRELTGEVFHARIRTIEKGVDEPLQKHYLRTGDLGFLYQGQLYVTGRLKDLIIVRGANHYPQDIELTVESSHPCLVRGGAAAFALDIDGEERVAVVQEVQRSSIRSFDEEGVFTAIRQVVAEEHEISLQAIVLVRPGSLPKTTSGKVQRGEARRMFLEDEFNTVARWDRRTDEMQPESLAQVDAPSQTRWTADVRTGCDDSRKKLSAEQVSAIGELCEWICRRLSRRLRIPVECLNLYEPFARFGMDSFCAVSLMGELSDRLGRSVPATLAYDYPNIYALSHYLVTGRSECADNTENQGSANEPLAVIGIGCRFPGGASVDRFWDLLRNGRDAISRVPVARWKGVFHGETDGSNEDELRGGFIEQVDRFDAPFFGISPREAQEIDPQQRLLLEVAWETFEDAGIPGNRLAGSRTGVFIGIGNNDYLRLQTMARRCVNGYSTTGNSSAIASNRISYTFDLRGPSWSVDTACSSSLVALHQAAKSLRAGECDMALAGGVNLILAPDTTSSFAQLGMLSASGACRAFSASADGFVRGEGCGLVLLKPLPQAVASGDRIYCVLLGSAVNQDGASNGLTAPNGVSQESVIRAALRDAEVLPEEVGYVEAHGTGTELGDPIEMRSIAAVYAAVEARSESLRVGSVKTNVGHLEAAAGIAGFIKVCLALDREAIPPHLHFDEPSPHIDWNRPLEIPKRLEAWRRNDRPRLASVSSFGFGGTNAHVVIREAPPAEPSAVDRQQPTVQLLSLSAKTAEALQQRAAEFSSARFEASFADVCYTANAGRTHFDHRLALRAASFEEASETLASYLRAAEPRGLHSGVADRAFSINWMFGGQGGCFIGAGKRLYERHAIFRAELDRCAEILAEFWPRSLHSILWEDRRLWLEVDIQPALFCLQYALGRLWSAWGVEPRAVLGHSMGEYAAACTAGVFGLHDAVKLITRRADLLRSLPLLGQMLVVFAGETDVQRQLSESPDLTDRIDIAAVNGPHQTVISGDGEVIQLASRHLNAAGFHTRDLAASHGFHSSLIEPIKEKFLAAAGEIDFARPQIPYISPVTVERLDEEVAQPLYWWRNLRETVRFYAASGHLVTEQRCRFLELGAGATLAGLVRSGYPNHEVVALPGVSGRQDEWDRTLDAVAKLYAEGASIDWRAVAGRQRRIVSMPTYPFQRKRHWFQGTDSTARIDTVSSRDGHLHPLLGRRLDLGLDDIVFEQDLDQVTFIKDHRVDSMIVFPAAGYLELALAGAESTTSERHEVRDLTIDRPFRVRADAPCRVQVVLSRQDEGFRCRILGKDGDQWLCYARCMLLRDPGGEDLPGQSKPLGQSIEADEFYRRCHDAGLDYGNAFRGVCSLIASSGKAWGCVTAPDELDQTGYLFHPALIDACFQVAGAALGDRSDEIWLPVRIGRYRLVQTPHAPMNVHVRLNEVPQTRHLNADLFISDSTGQCVATVEHLVLEASRRVNAERLIYRNQWVTQIRRHEPSPALSGLTPQLVEDRLVERRCDIAENTGIRNHVFLRESLESLSTEWILDTLRRSRFSFDVGCTFTTEDLACQLAIAPVHQRLLERMLRILNDDGYFDSVEGKWYVRQALPNVTPERSWNDLLTRYPVGQAEMTLLRRCAEALPSVLRGETDPLSLLFPEDGSISAAEVYRDSAGGRTVNALVAEAAASVIEQLGSGRGLRVLEIGAGTGATTEAVLARLPQTRTRYTFTDIAPGFLARASKRLHEYANVDYRVLDIERDPSEQDFEPSSYDLIIAANVLHATKELRASVSHIHHLLADGGCLLLVEGTRPLRWLDLTFGLTPGWWRFGDSDLRPDYPLVSSDDWRSLLEGCGFETPGVIDPLPPSEGGHTGESSIIVSRRRTGSACADALRTQGDSAAVSGSWMVLADQTGIGEALVCVLRERGEHCHVAYANDGGGTVGGDRDTSIEPDHLDEWARHVVAKSPRNVVFLWTLDTDETAGDPPEAAYRHCRSVLKLFQLLAEVPARDEHGVNGLLNLWIVTRGGQAVSEDADPAGVAQAPVWGVARTAMFEMPTLRCRVIDLDPAASDLSALTTLVDELSASAYDDEPEIAFRREERYVRRLVNCSDDRFASQEEPNEANVLELTSRGTLNGIGLVRRRRRAPEKDEVEVEIHASGLNFRDLLNVLGLYPGTPPLGAECTGLVSRTGSGCKHLSVGDRVAVVTPGSFCDVITVRADAVARLPDQLSLQAGATLPVAGLTASLALEEFGKICRDDRVLIHSAAGGVGMAAVRLALQVGAEVFATASTAKHPFVHHLGVQHVFDSRKPGFAEEILKATNRVGVDLLLNSLSDQFLEQNLASLAEGGRYVDITLGGSGTPQRVESLRPDVKYCRVSVAEFLAEHSGEIGTRLADVLERFSEIFPDGLPSCRFRLSEAPAAFRLMRSGKHTGKILLQPDRLVGTTGEQGTSSPRLLAAAADNGERKVIRSEGIYLITGGLGGLGLLTAKWLAQMGARHIALMARRDADEQQLHVLDALRQAGCRVTLVLANVSDLGQVTDGLERLRKMGPPLAGVFHLAGELNDAKLLEQTSAGFERVFAPKVKGAWNLHQATLEDRLDYFVLFSSAASIFGSPGQGNHAAANSFLDLLAVYRRCMGLAALSISWGPWSDVGAAAERVLARRGGLGGVGMLAPAEGLAILGHLLRQGDRVPSHVAGIRLHLERLSESLERLPLFDSLSREACKSASDGDRPGRFLETYHATPEAERQVLVALHLRRLIAGALGIDDASTIASDAALFDLGMDSLTSLELRNAMEASLETHVPSTLVFDYPTIDALAAYFVAHLPTQEGGRQESSRSNGGVCSENACGKRSAPVSGDQRTRDLLQSLHELNAELEYWEDDTA